MVARNIFKKKNKKVVELKNYLTDTSVIQIASNSKNGKKFQQLWSGDLSSFESHSEADLALCSILAFYCGGDKKQIDRLFRFSALYRDKWDEIHGRDTYGNLTIEKAVEGLLAIYTPTVVDEFNDELSRLKQDFQFPNGKLYTWNDIGASALFADFYKHVLRYVPERKSWFIYQSGIWKPVTGNLHAMKAVMKLANLVYLCGIEVIDKDKRKTFQRFTNKWQSHAYRNAILKDAQVYHPVKMRDFDKDYYILNCINETYHLKNKEFKSHCSSDLLTKMANVVYDKNAKSSKWNKFIQEIMSEDKDKIHFLQKMIGYGLVVTQVMNVL